LDLELVLHGFGIKGSQMELDLLVLGYGIGFSRINFRNGFTSDTGQIRSLDKKCGFLGTGGFH
jgi:hypothetical protein